MSRNCVMRVSADAARAADCVGGNDGNTAEQASLRGECKGTGSLVAA